MEFGGLNIVDYKFDNLEQIFQSEQLYWLDATELLIDIKR